MKRKLIIGSVALGLAAGAILLAVLSRRAPSPTHTPPDALNELGPVAHAFGRPAARAHLQPAERLEAVMEAVAAGRPQELAIHFADPRRVEPFYRRWRDEIPTGIARVVRADDVNAGAENGHTVPVTIWIEGTESVIGLAGDVSFSTGSDGVRIRDLSLKPLALKAPTWADAARLVVEEAKGGARQPQRLEAPFYGVFHMAVGQEQYTVNAVTGKVERE